MDEDSRSTAIEPHEFQARRSLYVFELVFYVAILCGMVLALVGDVDWRAKAIAALNLVFMTYGIKNVARLLSDPRPALQISEVGILNRTYWSSTTMVAWEDVLEIRRGRLPWLLDIVLRDPAEFRRNQTPMIRVFMRWLAVLGFGPLPIFLSQLKASRSDVYDSLSSALEAFELAEARKHRSLGAPRDSA